MHLDFTVDDVSAAVQRAVNAGAKLEGEIAKLEGEIAIFPRGRLATMSDPFGHGFCLLEFLGKGYDEVVTARGDNS